MHKLSRREVLRGAGVAALSVGAAVVPFAARATCDSAPGVADDPRLFDLAESAVIKIRNVRKLDQLTSQSGRSVGRACLRAGLSMALLTRSSNGERKLSAITSHTSAGAVRVRISYMTCSK